MKALVLDPKTKDSSDDFSILESIGREEDWEFEQIHSLGFALKQGGDAKNWVSRCMQQINHADAICCLGSYGLFLSAGDQAQYISELLVEKLRRGTPFLLQIPRLAEHLEERVYPPVVGEFIRKFNILPTRTKVGTDLNLSESVPDPYYCWFDKASDSLREPQLFKGVDRLYVQQPSLVFYDCDVSPIVDARRPDYFYVDYGDEFYSGDLGMHPTIAVESRAFDSIQIVMSGNVLSDPYQSELGCRFPVIADNRQFARNALRMISGEAKTAERYRASAFEIFVRLERTLGRLLTACIGEEAILQDLPESVRESLCAYTASPDFSNANFSDLVKLLLHHWARLAEHFGGFSKNKIKKLLNSVNSGPRRMLAHPHRAEREGVVFDAEDCADLQRLLDLVATALARCRG